MSLRHRHDLVGRSPDANCLSARGDAAAAPALRSWRSRRKRRVDRLDPDWVASSGVSAGALEDQGTSRGVASPTVSAAESGGDLNVSAGLCEQIPEKDLIRGGDRPADRCLELLDCSRRSEAVPQMKTPSASSPTYRDVDA
jgi:hypothetical protein